MAYIWKIDKSKCCQQKSLQRKNDDVSDGENKDRTSHMSHKDGQLKSDGKASDKPTSHDQERNKNRKSKRSDFEDQSFIPVEAANKLYYKVW